ncbi:hypothetical protein BDZ97DRAFT_2070800 [Flammula alnicola]|nr:hypothetical protein BDZ97DRAFT_2070800 [Flammula alnicola]
MARDPSLLDSNQPTAIAPATPAIAHVQLRDLLICPRERGVVNYVVPRAIVEQDLHAPDAPTRVLSQLSFTPNSLTSLPVGNDTLIAAGGQETEIHLSYHTPTSSSSASSSSSSSRTRRTRLAWEFEDHLTGSINNSVLLTSLSLTRSNESSVDPRVGISNNDGSVRLYDIPLRVQSARRKLHEVGQVNLEVPINHSSISPDGRTLLSVGDSNKVYFHQITGGSRITFAPITTLTIPPPDASPLPYASSSLAAAFSTAFSGDGSKFAVASQEGVVAVWDVRSTKPMKVFQTDKTRGMGGGMRGGEGGAGLVGNGGASGWLSDDPWEWTRGTKAPGWCVRSVKFNGGEGARLGKEVMAFTEHTSLVHVVDARTFETHDIIRVPTLQRPQPSRRTSSSSTAASTSTHRPSSATSTRTSNSNATGSTTNATTASNQNQNTTATAPTRTQSRTESLLADHERRVRNRNLVRRLLPVSNARRTVIGGASTSSTATPPAAGGTRTPDGGIEAGPLMRLPPLPHPPPPVSILDSPPSSAPTTTMATTSTTTTTSMAPIPTPAALASRLTPASAARLTAAASAVRGGARRTGSASASPGLGSGTARTPSSSSSSALTPTSGGGASGSTPAIVQALGDAFRIPVPASAYSAPASIGDSTWRTLGGTTGAGGALGRWGGGAAGGGSASASTAPGGGGDSRRAGDDGVRTDAVRHGQREFERMEDEDDREGIVVVPDLGDRDVESEVHALLAVHGISSRLGGGGEVGGNRRGGDRDVTRSGGGEGEESGMDGQEGYDAYLDDMGLGYEEGMEEDAEELTGDPEEWFLRAMAAANADRDTLEEEEDDDGGDRVDVDLEDEDRMDVDEDEDGEGEEDEDEDEDLDLEFECASGGNNSRSGSPFSSSIRGPADAGPSRRYGSHSHHASSSSTASSGWPLSASSTSRGPTPTAGAADKPDSDASSHHHHHRKGHGAALKKYGYYEDLDIAGLCFDPWGERMYVAGVGIGIGGVGVHGHAQHHGGGGAFGFGGGGGGGAHGHGYGLGAGVGLGAAGEGVGVGAVVEWSVRGAEKRWWVDDGWM